MKIKTSRFGEVDIEQSSCFEIIKPILGYENEKDFVIIQHDETSQFRWLQSLKTPELAFVVTIPGLFGIDYSFELPDGIQENLDITEANDILALNMVCIPHENPRESTINLLAPLIFNIKNNKGSQVVLSNSGLSVTYPLFEKEAVC